MPELRLKQRDRLVEKRLQIARLPLQLRRLAEIEEALEMNFDERELAQRDVERLAVRLAVASAGMELDGELGARHAVAKLVRQATGHLTQKTQALRAFDGFLILGKLLGHLIDRAGQVAELVVAARQRQGTEVAGGDDTRAPLQLPHTPAEALGHGDGQHQRRQAADDADIERRPNGLPYGVAPQRFRIEDVQRSARFVARADGHAEGEIGVARHTHARQFGQRFPARRDARQLVGQLGQRRQRPALVVVQRLAMRVARQ